MRQKFEIQEKVSKLENVSKKLAHFSETTPSYTPSQSNTHKSSTHSARNLVSISTQTGADVVSCRWASDGRFRDAAASLLFWRPGLAAVARAFVLPPMFLALPCRADASPGDRWARRIPCVPCRVNLCKATV